jgi:3,4-dihydroxy 2-butanone 4-phosphate synthase/GTP cyclohydrolase II
MNADGTMARRPDLEVFAREHDLKIGTIADLIHYRVLNEKTVEQINEGPLSTDYGDFHLHTFRDSTEGGVHLALVKGEIDAEHPVLVRVHVGSSVRDLLCSRPPQRQAGWNFHRCMQRVADEGCGVVVLLSHAESPDAIMEDVAFALGETPTPPLIKSTGSAPNTYFTVGVGSQILRQLGVGKMRLMGAPIKYNAISGFDLEVVGFESVDGSSTLTPPAGPDDE